MASIFKEPACEKNKSFGGWQFFIMICPLQPWLSLTPIVARRTTSQKFSSGSSLVQGGEQSIGTSSSARIALASFNCLPRPTYIFLFTLTAVFFCFFFGKNVLLYLSYIFTGLCIAPLDQTNTYGFVFSSMASHQACLLLNSAM